MTLGVNSRTSHRSACGSQREETGRTGLLERLALYGHEIGGQRDLSVLGRDRDRPAQRLSSPRT